METISPKQAAKAIGVSESSLKRWCDAGCIETSRTAGGHRRLSVPSLIKFLKSRGYPLARPELLCLPCQRMASLEALVKARPEFAEALMEGDEERVKRVLGELFMAGHSLSTIADELISPAFQAIGYQWECGELHVYRERLACEICLRGLFELRRLLPAPKENAPLAIGGAPDQDCYAIAPALAEMVLAQGGWRSLSLGSRLPLRTLQVAVEQEKPRLFWLSVSHLDDIPRFLTDYAAFYEAIRGKSAIIVGGRALTESIRRQMQFCAYCDSMRQLEALACTLKSFAEQGMSPCDAE